MPRGVRIAGPVPSPTPSLLIQVQDFFADLSILKDPGCVVKSAEFYVGVAMFQ